MKDVLLTHTPTPHPICLTGRPGKLPSQPFGMGLFSRLTMSHISPLTYQEEASALEMHSLKPCVQWAKVQRVRPAGEAEREREGDARLTWASWF